MKGGKGQDYIVLKGKGYLNGKLSSKKKKSKIIKKNTINYDNNCDKLTKNKFTTTIQYLELYNLYHVKVSVVVAS